MMIASLRRRGFGMSRRNVSKPAVSWIGSACALVWGAFWVWFAAWHLFDDAPGDALPVLGFTLPILALSIACVLAPRVGAILMIPSAVFAAWFFDDPGARLMLALPAMLVAGSLLWSGPWTRPALARRVVPRRFRKR
jgi:hypothetical protein